MPTYDYECKACGHTFEKFQSITAKPVRTCPDCGKKQVKRLLGAGAGILFKGSGFYQTDYRSESYRKAAEKDKPADKGGSKDESKSDAKSESAAPAKSSAAKSED